MSILVHEDTRVVVQGITGRHGSFHTKLMLEYGTKIVAGVTPGREGETLLGIPVYDEVETAVKRHGANASIIFVPRVAAGDAAIEAITAGLKVVVVITEHIPVHDMLIVKEEADNAGAVVVGPNTPGLISPGKCKLGIMPSDIFERGNIGIVSRSGTLTYEIVYALSQAGLYQSTCVGKGGDPITGTSTIRLLELFENDPETEAIVVIGEIGGSEEELAAQFIKDHMTKPVVAYVAGRSAPPEKRMGHAGAIISGGKGTAQSKIEAFRAAGIDVAARPSEVPGVLKKAMGI